MFLPANATRRRRALGVLCAAVVTACATTAAVSGAPRPLDGVEWHLVELGGRAALPAGELGAPVLRFDADGGRVSGNGGCNRMSGPYTRDGDALRIGTLVATRRACADPARNRQEADFVAALEATRRFAVRGDTLTLFGADTAVARLVARGGA